MVFLWYSAGFGRGSGRETVRYESNPCKTHQKNSGEINHLIRIDTVGGNAALLSAGCSLGDDKENHGGLGTVDLKLIYYTVRFFFARYTSCKCIKNLQDFSGNVSVLISSLLESDMDVFFYAKCWCVPICDWVGAFRNSL